MGLVDHPRLAPHARASDAEFIASARAFLTPGRLELFAENDGALYQRDTWSTMARLGLFSIFAPTEFGGQDRGAFGIALLADCLDADVLCSIDLAIYVQGLVAVMSLALNPKNPLACELLPEAASGKMIVCSAYTDSDRSKPVSGRANGENLVVNGAKTLIINAMHADYVMATVQLETEAATCLIDLKSRGISLKELTRTSGTGSFVQGYIGFENVVVPKSNILATGIARLWQWERVMSFSRLMNTSSILRTIETLERTADELLADRTVSGGKLSDMPIYGQWKSQANSTQMLLKSTIVDCILRLQSKERLGGFIAGLKARAGSTAYVLSNQALDMAGGSGVLTGNPLGKINASLRCKKFAAGGEYDLLTLYGASKRMQKPSPVGAR